MGAHHARKPGNSEQPETYPYPQLRPKRATKESLTRRELFEQERYMGAARCEARVTHNGAVSTSHQPCQQPPTMEVAHKTRSQTRLKRMYLHLALAQNASRRCSGLELLQVITDRCAQRAAREGGSAVQGQPGSARQPSNSGQETAISLPSPTKQSVDVPYSSTARGCSR